MKYTGVVKNQLGLMIIVNKSTSSRRIGSLNFLSKKKVYIAGFFYIYGIKPQPESLNEPLHLLRFTLDADVVLKFPQGFVELHALEVHFVYHTAGTWGEGWREKRQIHQNTDCHSFCAHPHSLVAQGWFGPDSIMEDMSVNSCHIGAISHSHRLWDLRRVNPLSNCLTVFICTTLLFKITKLSMLWIMLLSVITIFFLIIPVAILTPRHLCWTASVDCQEILQSSACLAPFSAAGSEPLRLACQGWILSQ